MVKGNAEGIGSSDARTAPRSRQLLDPAGFGKIAEDAETAFAGVRDGATIVRSRRPRSSTARNKE